MTEKTPETAFQKKTSREYAFPRKWAWAEKYPVGVKVLLCLLSSVFLCLFFLILIFSGQMSFLGMERGTLKNQKLVFTQPDFSADPQIEQEPPANPGFMIEHTPRGVVRFRTVAAGSPAFGTPIPEIIPSARGFFDTPSGEKDKKEEK